MFKAYRQIITYSPSLGHLYVPELNVRMRYGNGAYFLKTDKNGFRNSPKTSYGKLRILLLGDSYAAGDGVANEDRFSDYLEGAYDCSVTNIAVNGFGVDQQILAYEAYKDVIPHDVVVLAPHMDDIYRNMRSSRIGKNRAGNDIEIPKPYFDIENEVLKLNNVPVPKSRKIVNSTSESEAESKSLNALKNKVKYSINRTVGKTLIGKISYPELNEGSSSEWILMDALLKRLISQLRNKRLIIMPLPYNYIIANKEPQYYREMFEQYQTENVVYADPMVFLQKQYSAHKEDFFLPLCGHYTALAHNFVGKFLGEILQGHGLTKRQQFISHAKKDTRGFVLGISCFYHDSAAAIIKNGKIVAAAQEERFTRIKHDKNFPFNAIHYCLEEAELQINDLEAICYYDDEALTIERVISNYAVLQDKEQGKFWELASQSLFKKLTLQHTLRKHFNYDGKLFKTNHHHSHAASAFYPSPFDKAAIIVVDGVGEWACSTVGVGNGAKIELLIQQNYPHSLGLLYSAITYFCGFKVNSGEYKLMGLAPYGKPKYADLIKQHVIQIYDDGSIKLDMDYFSFLKGDKMTSDKLAHLFGGSERTAESRITQREMDLAASIQSVTEDILEKMIAHARKITGMENCVMAGGVALNCVANGKLLKKGAFKDIWFQPAAGDAGGALGAALDYYYQRIHKEKEKNPGSKQTHAYYGPSFHDSEILSFLETGEIVFDRFEDKVKQLSGWLSEELIVGYFDGRMEFGPRALGNRSFIADPTNPKMQSKVNLKIKYRESFRPFAPIVAADKLSEYFDIDRPSPFMLVVAPVADKIKREVKNSQSGQDLVEIVNQVRSALPAITHVDYSARLQSMNGTDNNNLDFYNLLKAFEKESGYAVLVNTSFNVRGEPIVCTPEDAYRCFMRTETDVLVLGNYYIKKSDQPEWKEDERWQETFELD